MDKPRIPEEALRAFCEKHKVIRLALFGSVLRDDFREDSDVDVLVEFAPDAHVGLIGLAGMERELSALIGHKGEIHTRRGLNPRFAEKVLEEAEPYYEQA